MKFFIIWFLSLLCGNFLIKEYEKHGFLGVLSTGDMSLDLIKDGISIYSQRGHFKKLEILLHPGGLSESEANNWGFQNIFLKFYTSEGRKRELALATGKGLREIIDKI